MCLLVQKNTNKSILNLGDLKYDMHRNGVLTLNCPSLQSFCEFCTPSKVVLNEAERSFWPVRQLYGRHHQEVTRYSAHLSSVPRSRQVCWPVHLLYGRHHEDVRGYSDVVPTYVVFQVVERSAWPVHQLHDCHHEDVRGYSAHLCSVPRGREVCLACPPAP